jgi:microcystin-dependent protein
MGVPDRRGTVAVGRPSMQATAGTRAVGITDSVTNTLFGEAAHQLTVAEMPAHRHNIGLSDPGHAHGGVFVSINGYNSPGGATSVVGSLNGGNTSANNTGIQVTDGVGNVNQTAISGSNGFHNNVQPSTSCNYILRLA